MTSFGMRGSTAAAATVLTLTLVVSACGSGGSGQQRALTAPSAPAATGTGPYPTPSASRTAAPVFPAPASTGPPGDGVLRPGDVEQDDADAVSRGALTVLWTFDTTVDRSPRDAELRAAEAGWLTEEYAEQLRTRRSRSAPGAQWQEWAGHRARTTVELEKTEDAAKPADTGTRAWRQWSVTTIASGRDNWTGTPVVVAVILYLTRTSAGEAWRVADVTVQ